MLRVALRIACGGILGLLLSQSILSNASAQLRGIVVDGISGEQIPRATLRRLSLSDTVLGVQLGNVDGGFRLDTTSVQWAKLQVHSVGYRDTIILRQDVQNATNLRIPLYPSSHTEITITAQRHAATVGEIPVSVSTINADEIHSRAPVGLDNVLRYIPGVSVTQDEVNIRGASGYARSIGSRVLLLLDGMPFLTADNGDIDFDALPLFDIDRVEVVKGAGSALYGSSALGGVVNVITRRPPEGFHGAFQTTGGMYDNPSYAQWVVPGLGRRFGNADIGGSGDFGDISALASAGYMRDEGYRFGDDRYRWHAFAKLDSRLTDHSSLDVSTVLANENHAGWLYWKSLAQPLQPSDSASAVNGRIHSFKSNVMANYSTASTGEGETEVLGSIKANVLHTDFVTDPSMPGVTDGDHSSANSWNGEADGSMNLSKELFMTGGLTGSYQSVVSDLFQNHNGVLLGAFAQAEIKPLVGVTVTAGGRYDHIQYDQLQSDGQLSPKIGVTYAITPELSARASYGYGFRAPAIAERFTSSTINGFLVKPNLTLQAERSKSYETGLSYGDLHLKLDGAVFYSTFEQLIQPSFVTSQGTSFVQFQNITRAQLFGHEEDVSYYPFGGNQALIRVSYTYVFPQDLVTKQILEFRPRHLFQAHGEVRAFGFTGGLDFRYISAYETFDSSLAIQVVKDGQARVPIRVLDARISYSLEPIIHQAIDLSFQVLNLLNYYYVEIVGNMAPLRSFSLQVQSHF
jgi:iron complex outermembrane receptor protein